jgi:beta-lactamase class D
MMKHIFFFLAAALFAVASRAAVPDWVETPAFADVFTEAGVEGTVLVYDEQADQWRVHDAARAREGFIPASTFKIFNALVALETGTVADEFEVIKWDGEKRWLPVWNRDHSLASAMKFSVVWLNQEVARRAGAERMQHWLDAADYGNRDRGGSVDHFWLDGPLRITAEQQIVFLRRLADGTLPFAKRHQETVRRITTIEDGPDYTLHGKTGWATKVQDGKDLGWLVGWAERNGRRWFFALNIDMTDKDDAAKRHSLMRRILIDLGALPASAATPQQ